MSFNSGSMRYWGNHEGGASGYGDQMLQARSKIKGKLKLDLQWTPVLNSNRRYISITCEEHSGIWIPLKLFLELIRQLVWLLWMVFGMISENKRCKDDSNWQSFFNNLIYSFPPCFWYIAMHGLVAVGDHYNDGFDPSLHPCLHPEQCSAGSI